MRAEAFAQKQSGSTPTQRIKIAMRRLIIFAALWIGAFATLPTLPVTVALVGWTAWIIPKVRSVNLEFQNVGDV